MKSYSMYPKKRVLLIAVMLTAFTSLTKGQAYTIDKTLSDGAQRNTIAFDGLGFITGNFCACTFLPPGKVADYFSFQSMRDNDITHMGHTTDFLSVIANNLLFILDSAQKSRLVTVAEAQVAGIRQYAVDRLPLIKAFIRLRDQDLPAGSPGLDREAVKAYSGNLYELDGKLSLERARLYAEILGSMSQNQKHYLDSLYGLGMLHMPALPEQLDKAQMSNEVFVAAMSFAGDIFSWYTGNVSSDVYFCPERQGNYFGGFYIKDAPAMGNPGFSIDTNLTQHGGESFLAALTPVQEAMITQLVDTQKTDLYAIVDRRTEISVMLRSLLSGNQADSAAIMNLSRIYGRLDGEISYWYAAHFAQVNWTLTSTQREVLDSLRNLDEYPCSGAYIYSDPVPEPDVISTDFLFINGAGNNAPVSVSIIAGTSGPVCQGTRVTFTATAVNGGTAPSYRWNVNGVQAGDDSSTFTYRPADNDRINCVLTSSLSYMQGNPAASDTLVMHVIPSPAVDLGNDTVLPQNASLLLDAGAGPYHYAWSTGDTTQAILAAVTGFYVVTVTNSRQCQASDSIFVRFGVAPFSGTVFYDNPAHTPLENLTVNLVQADTVAVSSTTGNTGQFTFNNYQPGMFSVEVACTRPWGGVNSADALHIMRYFVGLIHMNPLHTLAADVDGNGYVNVADALMTQRRFVSMITAFPAGDWVFESKVMVLDGLSPVVVDIKGACMGDVNGSYLMPAP